MRVLHVARRLLRIYEGQPTRQPKAVPSVERLEQRDTPAGASFRWIGTISDRLWTTPDNWEYYDNLFGWSPCFADYPGRGGETADQVSFGSYGNVQCIANANVTVHSLAIEQGYHGAVQLPNTTLTIANVGGAAGSMVIDSPTATFGGYTNPTNQAISRGSLILSNTSTFNWKAGRLTDLSADIQRTSATTAASMGVFFSDNRLREMRSTTLAVSGQLAWVGGDVDVAAPAAGQPPSAVDIRTFGRFNVTAPNGRWGDETWADTSRFGVINRGTTTVEQADATKHVALIGNYTTESLTQVKTGKLMVAGATEQGVGGAFELFNNSVVEPAINTTGVLGIRNGRLLGQGTVQGNVVLGDPNAGAGMISPGFDTLNPQGMPIVRGVGTITITGSFHMQSGNSVMQIDINGAGGFDQVLVTGYAALGGILSVTHDLAYKPAKGTTLAFLVAAGGAGIQGDFANKIIPTHVWQHQANPMRPHSWYQTPTPDPNWYSLVVITG